MRTIASETEALGLKFYMNVTTQRELSYLKNHEFPCVVPAGTKIDIYFSETNPSRIYFEYAGHLRCVRPVNANTNFIGGHFMKATKQPHS